MEETEATLLLLHVNGGAIPPQHLYCLPDYEVFHQYLKDNYRFLMTWDRAGQLIEIWRRY
jgi:hypothetical protein